MKRKRITRTTLKEHEVIVVKSLRRLPALPRCQRCPQQVSLITLVDAVILVGLNSRVIHQWIESERIHFAETQQGMVLVCPASLLEQTWQGRPVAAGSGGS